MFEKDLEELKDISSDLYMFSKEYPTVSVFKELDDRLTEIIFAYRMMSSCLVYGEDFSKRFNDYTKYLSEEQLSEMYDEYKKYFEENVEVIKNVATDSDGVIYYSSREK